MGHDIFNTNSKKCKIQKNGLGESAFSRYFKIHVIITKPLSAFLQETPTS